MHFRADIDHHGVPDRGLGPGADTLEAVAPDKGEEFTRGFRRADLRTLEIRDIDEVHRGAGDERIYRGDGGPEIASLDEAETRPLGFPEPDAV